jgi:hypothetical protein
MQGMAGYKIWLSVGLLLGEGAYIMAKAVMLGEGCCCIVCTVVLRCSAVLWRSEGIVTDTILCRHAV